MAINAMASAASGPPSIGKPGRPSDRAAAGAGHWTDGARPGAERPAPGPPAPVPIPAGEPAAAGLAPPAEPAAAPPLASAAAPGRPPPAVPAGQLKPKPDSGIGAGMTLMIERQPLAW